MDQLSRPSDRQDSQSAEHFSPLFPHPVGAAAIRLADHVFPLLSAEEPAVVKAVAKRRIEFSAGRHCARLAMAQLGHPACAIPSGADRAPVWPPGLTGSITHSTGICAAVVAPLRQFRSIGIDMEPIDAVPGELEKDVLRADEMAAFDRHVRPHGADRLTLHFCLKEAAYKAFYPLVRRIIGFHDMRVSVNPERGEFRAEAQAETARTIAVFRGRYIVRDGRIHAACW